jgi:hypothetical protein
MKKITVFLASMTMVFCMSAFAQTTDTMNNNGGAMASGKMHRSVGCVQEKDGKYMLVNKKHPDGIMLMGSQDMQPHVGHKVKVMGTMTPDSTNSGMMDMDVTKMKMISTTCDMNGTMSK